MTRTLIAAILIAAGFATTASAGDRLSHSEVRRISGVLADAGCYGGRIEKDADDWEDRYEVEGALCPDGRRYDIELNPHFRVTRAKED